MNNDFAYSFCMRTLRVVSVRMRQSTTLYGEMVQENKITIYFLVFQ